MHSFRRDMPLLRDRRFRSLLSARTIAVLGSSFAPVALAFGVLDIPGATPATLSIVLAAEATPMVAFLLLGGVIADRLPRRDVMIAGELLNTVCFFAIATMLLTGWTPLPALVITAALQGIGMAVFYPALTGIVPEVVPAEHLQSANGLLGLGANGARIGGIVLGGGSVALIGPAPALYACGLLFAVSAALFAPLGRSSPIRDGAAPRTSVLSDLREGWQIFISKQWLWVVVLQFSLLIMALQAAHAVFGPVLAKQELGGAGAWSAVLTGQALGMIVGVVIAMRIRPRYPIRIATLAILFTVVPYTLLGLGAPLWTVVAGAFVYGVSFDIFGVLWNTTMQREIPPESLSRVSSYDALGSLMFGPIGLLLAGPVVIAIGPRPALLAAAGIIAAVTLAALLAPSVRNLRAPTVSDAPPELAEATR